MRPGDVVVGAQETKVRPAVVIASATYLAERPDAVVGILTTKLPRTSIDYVLYGLAIGRTPLSVRDWDGVRTCVRATFAI